jgi:hypothetical protein
VFCAPVETAVIVPEASGGEAADARVVSTSAPINPAAIANVFEHVFDARGFCNIRISILQIRKTNFHSTLPVDDQEDSFLHSFGGKLQSMQYQWK